jgi:outer membrane PBP1 activator LpoA protein
MAEAKRISEDNQDKNLEMEGFETFFESEELNPIEGATTRGEEVMQHQMEKLIGKLSELITLSVDQRLETSKIGNQLIDNQRQLIATQQILIKLMERSIELTRHVTSIEERLPALFELPRVVESLRQRVAQLEGIETR